MILLDTSILIDHLRGRPEPGRLMREALLSGRMIAASVLTRVEILGAMRSAERASVRAALSAVDWLPMTGEVADRAGRFARTYRRSHSSIDVVDYVIAATAQQYEADLWTRNIRHFPMFKRLTAPY
jgi:predicted nucleic acid-binding protein